MKLCKYIFTLVLSVWIGNQTIAQNHNITQITKANNYLATRGEVYFKFKIPIGCKLDHISKIISIDQLKDGYIYTYANNKGFTKFLNLNLNFEVLVPSSFNINMNLKSDSEDTILNNYPTYEEYIAMMNTFAEKYPNICKLENIGKSINDRDILFLKISDNADIKEAEPEFMYSSSMHGDELTGYILMLKLIDYLLSNYSNDTTVKYLVDNIEIWINPLANPDGTYFLGNHTVIGATRFNANSIDLNRNFPDPEDGEHPDGNDWQPENIAMMNFMKKHHFILSANLHGGAEVVNYPWDTWEERHPDDSWFQYISRQYADTALKYSNNTYLTGFNKGIVNGYDWYTISGGRQDYVTYFLHGREVTLELSTTKTPSADLLPTYWEYNYRSLLKYMSNCLTGITGIVTDSLNGKPLMATIELVNHDKNKSYILSDSINGNYHRMIDSGIYTVKYTSDGYISKTYENIYINKDDTYPLNVELKPIGSDKDNISINKLGATIYPNPFTDQIIIENYTLSYINEIKIYNILGNSIKGINISTLLNNRILIKFNKDLSEGYYYIMIYTDKEIYNYKALKSSK